MTGSDAARKPRPRLRRERSASESLLSIALLLEAVLVFFVVMVAFGLRVLPTGVVFGGGAALVVLLLVAGRLAGGPVGAWIGWVLQVALIAGLSVGFMYWLTVCPRHFAPDDPYLRAADLPLAPVDVCDALAKVELCTFWVVYVIDFDEGGVGVGEPSGWWWDARGLEAAQEGGGSGCKLRMRKSLRNERVTRFSQRCCECVYPKEGLESGSSTLARPLP